MLIKPCENCGKECKVPPTRVKHFHYCSKTCLMAARGSTKQCAQCGKSLRVVKALTERKRFCSKKCSTDFYRGSILVSRVRVCSVCGNDFVSAGPNRKSTTCSKVCANKARGGHSTHALPRDSVKVEVKCQVCGKSMMVFPSRLPTKKTCSRKCYGALLTATRRGIFKASTIVDCATCGKPVRKPKCRIKQGSRSYCNERCYLASNQSGLEDKIVAWLQEHKVPYEQQVKVGRFNVDFMVRGIVVEANGCYWHGCPEHNPPRNATQKRRTARDAHLARYCAYHNIQLISIWEHDVDNTDFSTLFALL